MLLIRLYTLEPAIFPLPLPSSDMKEPLNIYFCGGLNLVVYSIEVLWHGWHWKEVGVSCVCCSRGICPFVGCVDFLGVEW